MKLKVKRKARPLKKGRFYRHHDSNGGHPSLIIGARKKKKQYKAICFTSDKESGYRKLKHDINPKRNKKSYVKNVPINADDKTFVKSEWKGLRIHPEDKPTINLIKRKKNWLRLHVKEKFTINRSRKNLLAINSLITVYASLREKSREKQKNMIFVYIAVILLVSGVVGKIAGTAGIFELTNTISPYITVGIFVVVLIIIYKFTKRR